jgi:hypothetical protein
LRELTGALAHEGVPAAGLRQAGKVNGPQAAEVKALYRAYLHQPPTPAQLKQGIALVAAGETVQLQAQILGSPTYFSKRAHRNNARFLVAVAQDVLHHPLDPAHLQQYSALLAHGTSRTAVALLLLQPKPMPGVPPTPLPLAPHDTTPPTLVILGPAPGLVTDHNIVLTGRVTDDASGVASLLGAVDTAAPAPVSIDAAGNFQLTTALALDGSADGSHTIHLTAADGSGNVSHTDFAFTLATAGSFTLDPSVATTLGTSTRFLYTGPNPVQQGVAPGIIDFQRVAVLRGKVLGHDGSALAGVTITVFGHPEYGSTQTQSDGTFSLAVNGGGLLTVNYAKTGLLPMQRQVQAPWQDYAQLPDVVLSPLDGQVTTIDLTSAAPVQVARGSPMTDASGTRQATLFFFAGTQAALTMPDGTTQPLSTLHVRATEYSVAPNGVQAMPADLPPTSGYTFAAEFSVDEATAAGATGVRFDRPVSFYVENFLNLPVGGIVPVGSYDRTQAKWLPAPNGRIVKILSVTNGLADLDVDGSGQAAGAAALAALGITDAERQQLAGLYQPGLSFWRVPIAHFTPFDT